jgi:hypothetical protein
MTVDDLLTSMNEFGFEDTDISEKQNALNFAIKNITQRKMWSFLDTVMSLTFDGSNATPSNTPADLRAVRKIIDTSTGRRALQAHRRHGGAVRLHADAGGDPYYYYFEGRTLKVYQVPPAHADAADPLRALRGKVASGIRRARSSSRRTATRQSCSARCSTCTTSRTTPSWRSGLSPRPRTASRCSTEAFGVKQDDEPEYIHVVDDDDWYDDFYH